MLLYDDGVGAEGALGCWWRVKWPQSNSQPGESGRPGPSPQLAQLLGKQGALALKS